MSVREVPLFPLNTVLFPGGVLPLRIFEPRYLDMVSRCMKQETSFGVVAIHRGQEAGEVASFHEIGTLARIVDFDCLEDGLLGITCRGEQRFRVLSQRLQADRLCIGEVEILSEDPRATLVANHNPLLKLLRNILEREEMEPYTRFLVLDWNDAAWVSNRLAEILPLPVKAKQILLELNDPTQRLDVLNTLLQE
jgi:Lon protease-like protein